MPDTGIRLFTAHKHDSIMLQRAFMRKKLLETRQKLDPGIYDKSAHKAQELLLMSRDWQCATHIGLYMPIKNELDTSILLKNAWQSGKKVWLPRIMDKNGGIMGMCQCHSRADLRPGTFNIPEPAGTPVLTPPLELVVVPGIGFDLKGSRLGYGGGYYDRFLARYPSPGPCRIGMCHSSQIADDIPTQPWDMTMHALCTEEKVIWI